MASYKISKKLTIAIFLLIIAIIGTGFYINTERPVPVRTTTIKPGNLHAELLAVGTITSRHQVDISANTQGVVTEILVEENQSVNKGDVLLRVDDREAKAEIDKFKAILLRYQTEAERAERNLNSLVKILNEGGEARQTVEDAESELKITRARIQEIKKELELAALQLEKMTIHSPFTGVITSRSAEIGQRVTSGSTLFTLTDAAALEVEVDVDASDIADVAVGQKVLVSSDSFPGKSWSAEVIELGSAVFRDKKENTNFITIRIGFISESGSLRVGEQIDAKIRTASRKNTLKLPFSAVIQRNNKTFVAIIQGERLAYIPVETGLENLTHIEILDGIESGDEIALVKGRRLKMGTKVVSVPVRPKS